MNIASAQTAPANPAALNVLAQLVPAKQTDGRADANPLDLFLSLLAGDLEAVCDQNIGGEPVATKPARRTKEDDKKDAAAILWAVALAPPPDVPRPLALTAPLAIENGPDLQSGSTDQAAIAANIPGNASVPGGATIPDRLAAAAPMPAAGVPILQMAAPGESDARATFTVNTAPPSLELKTAPIAFALKIEELASQQKPAAVDGDTMAVAPPSDISSAHDLRSASTPGPPPFEIERTARAAGVAGPGRSSNESTGSRAASAPQSNAQEPTVAATSWRVNGLPAKAREAEEANRTTAERDGATAPGVQQGNTKDAGRRPAESDDAAPADMGSSRQTGPAETPVVVRTQELGEVNAGLPRDTAPRRSEAPTASTPALGMSEPATVPALQATREISMRLTPAESPSVDIKLVDRAGSVHVAVRTSDVDLARNLQSGLSDLVHRLERKGFEAEMWSPGGNAGPATASSRQSDGDSTWRQNGRDPRDEAQQGNPEQNNGRNRPKWVAELEQRLQASDGDRAFSI